MADKPLVIDTAGNNQLSSDLNSWHFIDQQERFISSIETSTINEEGVDVGTIVSGIPTVFARVNLFRSAIAACANQSRLVSNGNLQTYYAQLASEWKGLIAAIACDYPNFNVRRVDMQYSDGGSIENASNIYEPKGAFGNMLMVGKTLWCNQVKGDQSSNIPFIDIIKYDGQVVAGTSPDTMVFTSIGYHISDNFAQDKPWINHYTGRFQDPLEGNIGNSLCELMILHHPLGVQVFHRYLTVYTSDSSRNLVQIVTANVGDSGLSLSQSHGHLAVIV